MSFDFLNSRKALFYSWFLVIAYSFFVLLPNLFSDFFILDDKALLFSHKYQTNDFFVLLQRVFTPGNLLDYYPIRDLSHLIDKFVFGTKPWSFRLQNYALYLASCWLFFRLLLELKLPQYLQIFGLILFAWNPIQAEIVTWISSRKDLLSIVFMLLCLSSAMRFLKTQAHSSAIISLCFLILSLFSKATYILFPLFFLAFCLFENSNRRTLAYALVANLIAFISGLTHLIHYRTSYPLHYAYNLSEKLTSSLISLGSSLKSLLGFQLTEFDLDFNDEWFSQRLYLAILGGLLLVFLISSLFHAVKKRDKPQFYIILIFFLIFLPTSSLLFNHVVLYAPRYSYHLLPLTIIFLFKHKIFSSIVVRLVPVIIFVLMITFQTNASLWYEPIEIFRQRSASSKENVFNHVYYLTLLKLKDPKGEEFETVRDRLQNLCLEGVPKTKSCFPVWNNYILTAREPQKYRQRLAHVIELAKKLPKRDIDYLRSANLNLLILYHAYVTDNLESFHKSDLNYFVRLNVSDLEYALALCLMGRTEEAQSLIKFRINEKTLTSENLKDFLSELELKFGSDKMKIPKLCFEI